MLIYKMTHLPTGKIYIGSLKNSNRWNSYNTSSKTIKAMMSANPEEWKREIFRDKFPKSWGWTEVVNCEHRLIRDYVYRYGWDLVLNGYYNINQGNVYSPESREKAAETMRLPENRLQNSLRITTYFVNNPKACEYLSNATTQWMINNPEQWLKNQTKATAIKQTEKFKKAHSERQSADMAIAENRKKIAEGNKRFYKDNPQAIEENRERLIAIRGKAAILTLNDGTKIPSRATKTTAHELGIRDQALRSMLEQKPLSGKKTPTAKITIKQSKYIGKVIISANYI